MNICDSLEFPELSTESPVPILLHIWLWECMRWFGGNISEGLWWWDKGRCSYCLREGRRLVPLHVSWRVTILAMQSLQSSALSLLHSKAKPLQMVTSNIPSTVFLGPLKHIGHCLCTKMLGILFSNSNGLLNVSINLMAPVAINTKKITELSCLFLVKGVICISLWHCA